MRSDCSVFAEYAPRIDYPPNQDSILNKKYHPEIFRMIFKISLILIIIYHLVRCKIGIYIFLKVSRYATNILLGSDIIHMSLSPQVLITCAPEKETLIMTPAEKEKIITENRPFIRQHVKQKFPKFMKIYDELCSAAEAAVWLELEKYLPEKGTITTFMSSRIRHGASTYIAKNIFNVSIYYYRKMAIILKYTNSHEDIDLHCFNDVNSFIDTDTLIKKISEGTDLPERTVRNTLAVCRINNPIFRDSTQVFVDQTSYSNHEDSYVDNEDISIALSELDNIDQQIIIYKFELNHKPALSDEDIAKRLSLSQEDVVSRLACCLKILENSLVLKKYIRRCNLPALQ